MSDDIVRQAERAFATGQISEMDYETILVRNGRLPLAPRYNYRDFAKWIRPKGYLGRALPALKAFLYEPAVILSSEAVGDYQGTYYAILAVVNGPLYNGVTTFAMWSDYFGSCGYCDAYEDAHEYDQFEMIQGTLANVKQFWSLEEMETFYKTEMGDPEYYSWHPFPLELISLARAKLGA